MSRLGSAPAINNVFATSAGPYVDAAPNAQNAFIDPDSMARIARTTDKNPKNEA